MVTIQFLPPVVQWCPFKNKVKFLSYTAPGSGPSFLVLNPGSESLLKEIDKFTSNSSPTMNDIS